MARTGPKPRWQPKTKTQELMLPRYRGWSPQKRMEHAVRRVMTDGLSQAQAARELGVSTSRLNEHVKKAREAAVAAEARSAVYADERAGVAVPSVGAGPLGLQERTRVPSPR